MEYKFTTENFTEEVLQSKLPVLVDFYADWCGPCKMMAPVIEKIAGEYEGRLKVGKCNVDDAMGLAQTYRVVSIPNLQLFKGGQVVANYVGFLSEEALKEKLEKDL